MVECIGYGSLHYYKDFTKITNAYMYSCMIRGRRGQMKLAILTILLDRNVTRLLEIGQQMCYFSGYT